MKKIGGKGVSNVVVIALVVALVAVVAGGAVVIIRLLNRETGEPVNTAGLQIGYATDVGVALSEDDLQEQMDALLSRDTMMSLEYRNNANSTNGRDFECYIANSELNRYDMYIAIYADANMTDELFLSQLIRPGAAFDHISLERTLETGTHTVYCAMTQVAEENGELVIHNSTTVTMDFSVS